MAKAVSFKKASTQKAAADPGQKTEKGDVTQLRSKDVHLEKDNHKACFHARGGDSRQPDTISVVEYIDGKIASTELMDQEDGIKAMKALMDEGYQIVLPKQPNEKYAEQ
jgi:hypothetical protein